MLRHFEACTFKAFANLIQLLSFSTDISGKNNMYYIHYTSSCKKLFLRLIQSNGRSRDSVLFPSSDWLGFSNSHLQLFIQMSSR